MWIKRRKLESEMSDLAARMSRIEARVSCAEQTIAKPMTDPGNVDRVHEMRHRAETRIEARNTDPDMVAAELTAGEVDAILAVITDLESGDAVLLFTEDRKKGVPTFRTRRALGSAIAKLSETTEMPRYERMVKLWR